MEMVAEISFRRHIFIGVQLLTGNVHLHCCGITWNMFKTGRFRSQIRWENNSFSRPINNPCVLALEGSGRRQWLWPGLPSPLQTYSSCPAADNRSGLK